MIIVPTIQCEFNGANYCYAGEYPKDRKFIERYKQLMFMFGYYVRVQRTSEDRVAMWIKRK